MLSREALEAMVWGVCASRTNIEELMEAIDLYAKGEGWLLADGQEREAFMEGAKRVGPKNPRLMVEWGRAMKELVERTGVKHCSGCAKVKKVEAFGDERFAATGLRSRCKRCERGSMRARKGGAN